MRENNNKNIKKKKKKQQQQKKERRMEKSRLINHCISHTNALKLNGNAKASATNIAKAPI